MREFQSLVPRYLGRAWTAADGVSPERLDTAEKRLGVTLPASVRALYLGIGAVSELCTAHNRVRAPEALAVEDGHLVFMDESEDVVSWGIPVGDLAEAEPVAWQRNNTPPVEWYSEEKGVFELLESMFDWYVELGVLESRAG